MVQHRGVQPALMTHAPTLHRALHELGEQRFRGVVAGGIDGGPHLLPVITAGWPALRRGLPQSLVDLERTMPTSGILPWLGYQLKPVLAPITLRPAPLPTSARLALAGTGLFAAACALYVATRPTRLA